MQVCTSLQSDNHARTPPLTFFTGQTPFLPPEVKKKNKSNKKKQQPNQQTIEATE